MTHLDLLTAGGTYQLGAYSFGGFANSSVTVTLPAQPSFVQSKLTIPATAQSQIACAVTATISDGQGGYTTETVIALLEVRDVCSVSTGYECVRITSTQTNYVPNLLNSFLYQTMEGIGNVAVSFVPPLPGYYSMSVLALQSGVLAQYWDNIWFDGTFTTVIHDRINLTWTGALVGYAAQFVSAKYFFFVVPLYSEEYTFTIDGDDSYILYVNGNLTINGWNTSCQVLSGVYSMQAGSYYFLQIEFRQLLGTARLILYWQSRSQAFQIVPPDYIYWPTRIPDSPWVQTVTQGLSKASLCYFTGPSSIKAGYTTTMSFYSVDANGIIISNPTDIYTVQFTSTLFYSSTYVSNGQSTLSFSLPTAQTYTVSVTLYGISIKGSPFSLTVAGGDLSGLLTTTSILTTSSYPVGSFQSFPVAPFDAFGNSLQSSTGISMTLSLLSTPQSSLAVSPPTNWAITYGAQVVQYSALSISFKVYIAGSYSVSFTINSVTLAGYPKTITTSASSIMVEHSSVTYTSTQVVAGNNFTAEIQARDNYYNNLTTLSTLTSTFTSSGGDVGYISTSGGVITASIMLTIAGSISLTLSINSVAVALPVITVSASSILSSSTSALTQVTSTVAAGGLASALIVWKDAYGNSWYNPSDNYSIQIIGATWTVTDNKNGTYLIQFTPLTAQVYSINVTLNSIGIIGSPGTVTVSVSAIRGIYSAFTSTSNVVAGTGLFNITSKDIGGNTIANPVRNPLMGNQYYVAIFQGPQSLSVNGTFTDYSCFNINFTQITTAGSYTVALGLVEALGMKGFYYQDSAFTILYEIYPFYNNPGATPQYYTEKDPQVSFDWTKGNPIINNANIPNLFSAKWTGKVYPSYTQTYTFYVLCDYRSRLTVAGTILFDNISTGKVATLQSGNLALNASVFYDIVLEYQNGGSGGYIYLQYSSTSVSLQTIPSSALYTQINSNLSPYSFSVLPTATRASNCIVAAGDSDPLTTAYSGKLKTITITAYDKYGNAQTATDTFFGLFQNSAVTITISGSSGSYTGTFTLTAQGVSTLSLFLQLSTGVIQALKPIYITVRPGPASAPNTVVTSPQTISAGTWGDATIKLYDAANNPLTTGGTVVLVTIASAVNTVPATQILVTDLGTGSYDCKFVAYIADTYTIDVSVNGGSYVGPSLSVIALGANPNNCIVAAPASVTLGDIIDIEITVNDQYNNAVIQSYSVFAFLYLSTNPNAKLLKFVITAVSNSYYTGTVNFTLANIDISGKCVLPSTDLTCDFTGNLSLVSGIFAPGVFAQYYSNIEFTGVPAVTEVENLISKNWGSTALGISASNLGVTWEGLLVSQSAMQLQITGTGYAFFYADTLNIMRLPDLPQANLTTDVYYWVKISYNNTNSLAQFAVQWMNVAYVDVPAANWYRWLDDTHLTGADLVIESL